MVIGQLVDLPENFSESANHKPELRSPITTFLVHNISREIRKLSLIDW